MSEKRLHGAFVGGAINNSHNWHLLSAYYVPGTVLGSSSIYLIKFSEQFHFTNKEIEKD